MLTILIATSCNTKQYIHRHQRHALYFARLSACTLIQPTAAKRDVIHKTGST